MTCHLDGVNMYCWTHGRDISQAELFEDECMIGAVCDDLDDVPVIQHGPLHDILAEALDGSLSATGNENNE